MRLQARRGLKATNLRRSRTQIHHTPRHQGIRLSRLSRLIRLSRLSSETLMKTNSDIFGLKQKIFSDFVIVAKIPRLNILFSIFSLSSLLSEDRSSKITELEHYYHPEHQRLHLLFPFDHFMVKYLIIQMNNVKGKL